MTIKHLEEFGELIINEAKSYVGQANIFISQGHYEEAANSYANAAISYAKAVELLETDPSLASITTQLANYAVECGSNALKQYCSVGNQNNAKLWSTWTCNYSAIKLTQEFY